jgi:polysaccharide export outer membrane protein
MKSSHTRAWLLAAMLAGGVVTFAQTPAAPSAPAPQTAPKPTDPAVQPPPGAPSGTPSPSVVAGVEVPEHYIIGPGDVLGIVFWREKELSGDVAVLPDGRITLPLINEVAAAGLTPEQLRSALIEAARQFVTDPTATVVVRQVNSRRVFVTGMVAKPGQYPLYQTMTVLQLIATAGGLLEYAQSEDIVIIRREPGHIVSFSFNYKQVIKKKNLHQNIDLKPGDTVVVP